MLHIYSNPVSGTAALRSRILLHQLDESSIPYVLHTAEDPEEMQREFPAWKLTASDTLLIIGGDGTLNQTLRLLPEDNMPAVILLPSGSGNDFARGMRMKRGDSAAMRLIRARERNDEAFSGAGSPSAPRLSPCLLDCGEAAVTSAVPSAEAEAFRVPRRFAVSCGIGYDAGVTYDVNHGRLKSWMNRLHAGKLTYLLLGIKGIFRYKKASGSLTLDGSRTLTFRHLAFLSCHNLPYEGGGFAFAPAADARDGQLDICLITARSRAAFTFTLAASLFRLHTFLPNVRHIRCREASVHTDIPLPFHTDGDSCPGVTDFRIRVLPQRVPLLFEPGKD